MKKLLFLLLVVALGLAVYRRLRPSGSQGPAAPRAHRHGTPDQWPPVVRKPGAKRASAA